MSFEFQHNVCGRSIYAQGAVDACIFLAKKVVSNTFHIGDAGVGSVLNKIFDKDMTCCVARIECMDKLRIESHS